MATTASTSFSAVLVVEDWSNAIAISESSALSSVDLGGGVLGAYSLFVVGEGTPGVTGYAFDAAFGTCDCPGATAPPVNADPPFPPIWPYPTGLIYSREFFSVNLRMVREDTFIFDVSVVVNGNAVDVTGASFYFTAKYDFEDTNAQEVFTLGSGTGIEVLDATTGSLELTVSPGDTTPLPLAQTDLVYDLRMVDINLRVFSILRGTLTVVPNVTELIA